MLNFGGLLGFWPEREEDYDECRKLVNEQFNQEKLQHVNNVFSTEEFSCLENEAAL